MNAGTTKLKESSQSELLHIKVHDEPYRWGQVPGVDEYVSVYYFTYYHALTMILSKLPNNHTKWQPLIFMSTTHVKYDFVWLNWQE